jgi:hypothetical protein
MKRVAVRRKVSGTIKTSRDGKLSPITLQKLYTQVRLPYLTFEGIKENEAVPQAYLDKNVPIIQSRVVLGGYRLYGLIKYIFDPSA